MLTSKQHLALALTTVLVSCNTGPLVGPDGGVQCPSDFGTTADAQRLEAFLAASATFATQAETLDNELRTACVSIARDLGIPDSELQPSGNQTATQAACNRVAMQIRQDLMALRAEAGVQVFVEVTPPVCRVDVNAYSRCLAECDATFTPGMADLQCMGGEIRGRCTATCTGTCAVMASGSCTGSCEGTCTGSCTGNCVGQCEGTCTTRDASGNCMGMCMGTCRGTCSAGCTGSCMGQCVAMASGSCSGECRGMCSVAFEEPRCTGTVVPPMANADCRASCDARVNARADCSDPQVRVVILGMVSASNTMRADRVRTALQNNYGRVVKAAAQLRNLVTAGITLTQSARTLPNTVGSLGAMAGVCATQAATAVTQASARIEVSVMVSANVVASVN